AGAVDCPRRALGRDARLHGARSEPVPASEGRYFRRLLAVAYGRHAAPERGADPWGVVSDRGLQDLVLRALADAPFRASREWHDQALADPGPLERFARFLARHYYYERIVHFFKYSRALAPVTGRRPEAVLRSASFDALLATAVLGSRETARAVASVVVRDVQAATPSEPIPYLSDMLSYERAMMIAEAGPRVWRETAQGEGGSGKGAPPELVEGTVLLDLAYDLPAVRRPGDQELHRSRRRLRHLGPGLEQPGQHGRQVVSQVQEHRPFHKLRRRPLPASPFPLRRFSPDPRTRLRDHHRPLVAQHIAQVRDRLGRGRRLHVAHD